MRVNGEVETRRKRQLHDGDTIEVGDFVSVVAYGPDEDDDEQADELG